MAPTSLEKLITTRQSVRMYNPNKQVPEDLIRQALEVARYSSSNLNTQPWRLLFLSSEARNRVVTKLQAAWADQQPLAIEPIPASYKHHQENWGRAFFRDTLKFAREDGEQRFKWFLHNFDFFKAPVGAIVMMNKDFHHEDSLGVGIFLNAFVLVLRQMDIESCLMVSIAGYSEILRKELAIEDDMRILCGMAIGYSDLAHPANSFKAAKEPVDVFAQFLKK